MAGVSPLRRTTTPDGFLGHGRFSSRVFSSTRLLPRADVLRLNTHRGMITQAFVLGAGLGTRLRPLTDELPKPLIPIFQKPLITFCLDHLIAAGIERFVINTHHLPDQLGALFPDKFYRG